MSSQKEQAEIGLCLLIANADGEISDEEITELRAKLRAKAEKDTSDAVLDTLIESERETMHEKGTDAYLETLIARIPKEDREKAFRDAVDVAYADMLTKEEDALVRKVGKALGVDAKAVDEIAGPEI